MDQADLVPPPLPPKTRRSPPEVSTTVLSDSSEVYNVDDNHSTSHVVKIRINPKSSVTDDVICNVAPCIRISVNNPEMIPASAMVDTSPSSSAYFFYNVMSSGQVSPSDTLDSGTCSDMDTTPPPLPKKKNISGVSITLIQHKRASSLTDSDNDSNISCDSLNSGEEKSSVLPSTLLQDIRRHIKGPDNVTVKSYEERKQEEEKEEISEKISLNPDLFYNFHLNEHVSEDNNNKIKTVVEDETFAGYKDILGDSASTIRSAKGTVRGVKNRVRAGIATFLQINSAVKVRTIFTLDIVKNLQHFRVYKIFTAMNTCRGM